MWTFLSGLCRAGRGSEMILRPISVAASQSSPGSETAAEAAALLGNQGIAVGLLVPRLPEDVLDVFFLVAHLFQLFPGQVLCCQKGLQA